MKSNAPLNSQPPSLAAPRFEGLAQQYAQFRPSYPAAMFERLRELVGEDTLRGAPLLVDVGCGTGISTRLLRETFARPTPHSLGGREAGGEREPRVVGLEPSPDMRRQAEAMTSPQAGIQYIAAAAESLPLADGSAALIISAQAAHWFDRPRFYREAARVLVERGFLALAFNCRLWQVSDFMDEHERVLERLSPSYTRMYREIDFLAEAAQSGVFAPGERQEFFWEAALTLEQWLGFNRSTTYVRRAAEAHGQEAVEAQIIAVAERHLSSDRMLSVPYRTDLFAFQRQ